MTRNKGLRHKVFERDQGICAICKRYDAKWQHDHVLPLSLGGKDNLDNAQTLCRLHHSEKTSSEATPRAKADRLKERSDMTKRRKPMGLMI